jgi:hypothetical protein
MFFLENFVNSFASDYLSSTNKSRTQNRFTSVEGKSSTAFQSSVCNKHLPLHLNSTNKSTTISASKFHKNLKKGIR